MTTLRDRSGSAAPEREGSGSGRGTSRGHAGQRWWLPYALLALPALVYSVFLLLPLATTVRLSFYHWDGLTPPEFAGVSNYLDLFRDDTFVQAIVHNGVFLLFYTVVPLALALLLTALLTQEGAVRGLGVYRIGLFVPQVMPLVVVGVIWRWMYSPTDGMINAVLGFFGAGATPFLGDPATALPAVGLVASWVQYGFAMVLFMAGVAHIDRSLYDAAAVDGATAWQKFRHVTLPGLRGEIVVALTVSMIAALRVFDLIFVMTRGGPARATTVVAFEIYQRAFQLRDVGAAAAVATVLVVAIVILSRGVLSFREAD